MVMRFLEQTNIGPRTWVENTRSFQDTENPIDIFVAAINEFNLSNRVIGYEQYCIFFPYFYQQEIITKLPNAKFEDCSGIIEKDRLCKSELEIQMMRKAAKATEAGMHAGIEASAVGVSENEVAAKVHHAMYMAGGECPAERPYIAAGPRTLYGHATWEGYVAKPNDSFILEMAGCYRRYHAAMMRTVYLGEPTKAILAAEKAVINAINTVINTAKPGMTAAEIAKIATDVAHDGVISGRMISRPGYSLGIAFAPSWDEGHILSLKPGQNTKLKENMTFHLIPWLYGVEDKHCMYISETIRITENGAESLFDFPRQLFIKEPQQNKLSIENL
jgi:Xaa-Pro dipeptidase